MFSLFFIITICAYSLVFLLSGTFSLALGALSTLSKKKLLVSLLVDVLQLVFPFLVTVVGVNSIVGYDTLARHEGEGGAISYVIIFILPVVLALLAIPAIVFYVATEYAKHRLLLPYSIKPQRLRLSKGVEIPIYRGCNVAFRAVLIITHFLLSVTTGFVAGIV